MPGKSAGQGFEAFAHYSEEYVENPLTVMRGEVTQKEFAQVLGVNHAVVAAAEEGMFALIPTCYRTRIKSLMAANEQYQQHRKVKRRFYFDKTDFPDAPAFKDPMLKLLAYFELTPYKFGARSCVHHTEIWKMSTNKRMMTENFSHFLVDIDIDQAWRQQFNEALSRTFEAAVAIPKSAA